MKTHKYGYIDFNPHDIFAYVGGLDPIQIGIDFDNIYLQENL